MPALTDDNRGLGGGIAWAWDDDLCKPKELAGKNTDYLEDKFSDAGEPLKPPTELEELQKWQSEVLACEKDKLESLMAKSFDKLTIQEEGMHEMVFRGDGTVIEKGKQPIVPEASSP